VQIFLSKNSQNLLTLGTETKTAEIELMTKLSLRAEQRDKIRRIVKVGKDNTFQFLGCALNLETNQLPDLLEKGALNSDWGTQSLTALLAHYSLANNVAKTGKLVKFRDLPGGYAYEIAFEQRAVNPIAHAFGNSPVELAEVAELFGGRRLVYGDLSVEIPALEGIPIVYVLWGANEFSASANVLFDESATCFLDTEGLAVLGELTTHRLLKAQSILKEKKQ
jgi:hypothetical protein